MPPTWRAPLRVLSHTHTLSRSLATSSPVPRTHRRTRWIGGTALLLSPLLLSPLVFADSEEKDAKKTSNLSHVPLASLLRTYLVYTFTAFPTLIDHSPRILSALMSSPIPGVSPLTEFAVRHTFFKHFVAGESVVDCFPVIQELRERGIATLLAYSVEVDENDKSEHAVTSVSDKAEVQETLRAIQEAGSLERKMQQTSGTNVARGGTWIAVKITGLTDDPGALHRASNTLLRLRDLDSKAPHVAYPGTPSTADENLLGGTIPDTAFSRAISVNGPAANGGVLAGEEGLRESDRATLQKLWENLRRVGKQAQTYGVNIVIDAEHTHFQPALDGYTMLLSKEFNSARNSPEASLPLVYGTYQSYLRRNPEHLKASLEHAKKHGYTLGVKLVRGAYHEQERLRWKREGRSPFGLDPIWPNKQATDDSYNGAITVLTEELAHVESKGKLPPVGVLFATHNPVSCRLVLERLQEQGLATRNEEGKINLSPLAKSKICFGQLYGMADELTESLANEVGGLSVLKYVPYGKLSDEHLGPAQVMPYLGRRAIENKALLAGPEDPSAVERRRCSREIRRRIKDSILASS